MSEAGYVFKCLYKDDKQGLFRDGRLVAAYRRSGTVWRVTLFFPDSLQEYKATLCSSQRVARQAAVELAEQVRRQTPGELEG